MAAYWPCNDLILTLSWPHIDPDPYVPQETLVMFMEKAADCLQKAERFEVLGDVYKLIIPMYERSREFEVRHKLIILR